MPVAKNLKLDEARGISTFLQSHNGLPLSIHSAIAKASKFSSINVAMRFKIVNLSSALVTLHIGNAACAAATANCTSVSSLLAICPITCPVAGLILSKYVPLLGASHCPPM